MVTADCKWTPLCRCGATTYVDERDVTILRRRLGLVLRVGAELSIVIDGQHTPACARCFFVAHDRDPAGFAP